jgi:alkylation response protein AidB-like acyl-CoA dehydrogenase
MDQDALRTFIESLRRLLRTEFPFKARQSAISTQLGYPKDLWHSTADLGTFLLGLPESCGGLGFPMDASAAVLTTLGEALFVGPYADSVLGVPALLAPYTTGHPQSGAVVSLLNELGRGEATAALALREPGRSDLADVPATEARPVAGGFRVSGRKSAVVFGDRVTWLVVPARLVSDRAVQLHLIKAQDPDVRIDGYRRLDGFRAADVAFDAVFVPHTHSVTCDRPGSPVFEAGVLSLIAAAAEGIGIMRQLLQLTVSYLKERRAFGKRLANFQALQHRAVDMWAAVELVEAAVEQLVDAQNVPPNSERDRLIHGAAAVFHRQARHVGKEAVQLHGAMGTMDDYVVASAFKRLTVLTLVWAKPQDHLYRIAEILRDNAATATIAEQ